MPHYYVHACLNVIWNLFNHYFTAISMTDMVNECIYCFHQTWTFCIIYLSYICLSYIYLSYKDAIAFLVRFCICLTNNIFFNILHVVQPNSEYHLQQRYTHIEQSIRNS